VKAISISSAVLISSLFVMSCSRTAGPTDDAIATDVKAKLYSDATTRAANIGVAVKDGAVTLSGDVPSSDVELQAMKLVNATAGVRNVSDQLKVSAADATPPPPPTGASSFASSSTTPPASSASTATPPPPAVTPTPSANPPSSEAAATTPVPPPAPRRSVPATVTIPAGTSVSVRMIDGIDSKQNQAGQVFRASLDTPIVSGERVIAPAGSNASVILSNVSQAGRIKGRSGLEVRLSRLEVKGQSYAVSSSVLDQQGGGRGKQTAIRTGIGAAAGAIIGGLAGGGKGAAIGSAAGGGAGFGYNVFTHGSAVKIPSETVLTFRLEAPLSISR
jgi:hypothetical protein